LKWRSVSSTCRLAGEDGPRKELPIDPRLSQIRTTQSQVGPYDVIRISRGRRYFEDFIVSSSYDVIGMPKSSDVRNRQLQQGRTITRRARNSTFCCAANISPCAHATRVSNTNLTAMIFKISPRAGDFKPARRFSCGHIAHLPGANALGFLGDHPLHAGLAMLERLQPRRKVVGRGGRRVQQPDQRAQPPISLRDRSEISSWCFEHHFIASI
jgi:hypothetical protein